MCRKIAQLLFITVLAFTPAYAQTQGYDVTVANTINIFDANGKLFVNPDANISGSPYFIDNWKYGRVTLKTNVVYKQNFLRIDVVNQQIHYLSATNTEMSLDADYVKEVMLSDSATLPVTNYYFRSGFPAIDKQNEKFLYRVLAAGRLTLLACIRKNAVTEKNDFSGEAHSEYRLYEQLYMYAAGVMQRFKKEDVFIATLMHDQQEKIAVYTKQYRPNYRSVDDIKKLIEYYNSLYQP